MSIPKADKTTTLGSATSRLPPGHETGPRVVFQRLRERGIYPDIFVAENKPSLARQGPRPLHDARNLRA